MPINSHLNYSARKKEPTARLTPFFSARAPQIVGNALKLPPLLFFPVRRRRTHHLPTSHEVSLYTVLLHSANTHIHGHHRWIQGCQMASYICLIPIHIYVELVLADTNSVHILLVVHHCCKERQLRQYVFMFATTQLGNHGKGAKERY
jgi:hypothetical protein